MNRNIVVERPMDATLLRLLLAADTQAPSLRFRPANSKDGAESFARTLLGLNREPVVVVVNSYTYDPDTLLEEQVVIGDSLKEIAPTWMWRLVIAVPELEVCFFADPGFVEDLFGVQLTEEERVRAEYQPRRVLEELLRRRQSVYTPEVLADLLAGKDLTRVRESELIRGIRQAVATVGQRPVAVAS